MADTQVLERDGYLILSGMFGPEEIERLIDATAWFLCAARGLGSTAPASQPGQATKDDGLSYTGGHRRQETIFVPQNLRFFARRDDLIPTAPASQPGQATKNDGLSYTDGHRRRKTIVRATKQEKARCGQWFA